MIGIIKNWILKKYDVISFDIFDTLIERRTSRPSDVFRIVGQKVLGNGYEEEFRERRIKAEERARSKKDSREVSLAEIYEELTSYKEQNQELMNEEIRQELALCKRKDKICDFFDKGIKQNKMIFLISDMYLSKEVITAMVNKCGITGYQKLYVSNEYGVTKITGKLFETVLKENRISRKKIIHIGDSIKADFIGAHKAGIKSVLIGRKNRVGRLLNRK